jgi:hypothetical protein
MRSDRGKERFPASRRDAVARSTRFHLLCRLKQDEVALVRSRGSGRCPRWIAGAQKQKETRPRQLFGSSLAMTNEHIPATEFARQVYRVSTAWRREIDRRVPALALTDATWRPLLYLGRMGDGIRQTDFAAVLTIGNPSLGDCHIKLDDFRSRRFFFVASQRHGRTNQSLLLAILEQSCRYSLREWLM